MKKSTLIKSHELDRYLEIRELVKEYPNDMELGGKVRELFWGETEKEFWERNFEASFLKKKLLRSG